MARRKAAWVQEREARIARARETAYANRAPTTRTTVTPRKTATAIYTSYMLTRSGDVVNFRVQYSVASLAFFGTSLAVVGLRTNQQVPGQVPSKPRNFQPAKICARVGVATPTAYTTAWGSRVIKYTPNADGTTQANYSCPFSSGDDTPLLEELNTKAETLIASIAGKLGGDYGRAWLSPEQTSLIYA